VEAIVYLYKSGLSMDEILERFRKRSDKYRNVKGLMQKLYVRDESTGRVGGIYVFDSKENLEAFMNSDLEKSIDEAYKFVEPPTITKLEVVNVLFADKKPIA
jgi:heme-degrading monooxygenase HmoA